VTFHPARASLQTCAASAGSRSGAKESGTGASIEELFRAHWPLVLGYLRRRTRSEALAEELAQETFYRATRGFLGWRGEAPAAWLLAIARSALADEARRGVLLVPLRETAEEGIEEFDAPPSAPSCSPGSRDASADCWNSSTSAGTRTRRSRRCWARRPARSRRRSGARSALAEAYRKEADERPR